MMLVACQAFLHAEETNLLARPAYDDPAWNRATIPGLVEGSDVAGVGLFLNQPTTNDPYANVIVQNYWGGDSGTNVLRINVSPYQWQTDWVFPTNVPVVFFAIKRSSHTNNSEIVNLAEFYQTMPQSWLDELSFPGGDGAWFRTSRDNGLLYAFSTTLWNCVRTNPNTTNQYEVFRDAVKVPFSASSRLFIDTTSGLFFFLRGSADTFLVDKYNDPLLDGTGRQSIYGELYNRGWTRTNGVWNPPQ
jgi:hypothetical protein